MALCRNSGACRRENWDPPLRGPGASHRAAPRGKRAGHRQALASHLKLHALGPPSGARRHLVDRGAPIALLAAAAATAAPPLGVQAQLGGERAAGVAAALINIALDLLLDSRRRLSAALLTVQAPAGPQREQARSSTAAIVARAMASDLGVGSWAPWGATG